MPQPVTRDMHIDTLLSNISIGYMNEVDSYVADRVFPVLLQNKESGKIATYRLDDMFRDVAALRAPMTESKGGGFGVETPSTFFCDEYAFHQDIDENTKSGADIPFNLENDATRYVVETLRIKREILFASTFFATGLWGTDLQGQTDTPTTNQFLCWDETNSTPLEDVDGAKLIVRLATGLAPNTLLVSEKTHMALKRHSAIADLYKYTSSESITERLLAKAFEVDNYLVAKAVKATNNEGATLAMSYMLNQYGALLVYSVPRPSIFRASGGYTIRWNRPTINGAYGPRLAATIRKFNMPLIGATRIEGAFHEEMKLIASGCGVFFNNAISDGRTITAVTS